MPYYYAETLAPCTPNNVYSMPNKNRHTLTSYHYDERLLKKKSTPKLKSSLNASSELQCYTRSSSLQPHAFRPYSVLETSNKPAMLNFQRPSSVVPTMSDQYRPASFFVTENESSNEIPEWKARLQKEMPESYKSSDKPLRQICRIPNCKCGAKPTLNSGRFSEVRTLPTVSERSLNKIRNLSLPTLKIEELEKDEKDNRSGAEKDVVAAFGKPLSEQHLGYV